jgi:hypothetical protein
MRKSIKISLGFDKMATKFKMASETYIFKYSFQSLNFQLISKNLNASEASFYYKMFILKNYFSKIQNGEFFEDDVNLK